MKSNNQIKFITISEAIPENSNSTVYKIGETIEVVTVKNPSTGFKNFRKIDKNHYMNLKTGEILEYKKSDKKIDRLENFRKSHRNMNRIINANFTGKKDEYHIVLTYGSLMLDTVRLYSDFKNFIKALRKTSKVEYICIPEPHDNGRWHIHALIKSDSIITSEQIHQLWKHGISYVGYVPEIDNFGSYFSSYTTNYSSPIKHSLRSLKMQIKESRTKYYPANMKLYRHSRGIKAPKPERMTRP